MNSFKKIVYQNPSIRTVLSPLINLRRIALKKNYSKEKETINNIRRILIGDPIIRVDEFSGMFNVDIQSDLFFRLIQKNEYEPELVKLCLKYIDKNKDIIDIGANIGFFTVLFAKNIEKGSVLSIEPTKRTLERLYKNIKLNNVTNKVDVFEGVVTNANGTVEIKTIKGKEEFSSLGKMEHPSVANEQWTIETVKGITLDELVNLKSLNPGFIKIDVEGVEHLVFDGAQDVLNEYRPIILSELSDFLLKKNGSSAKEVINLIESCGYDIFDPIDPSSTPCIKDFGDIICFPKEMKVKLM